MGVVENNIYEVPNVLKEQNKALDAVIIATDNAGIYKINKEDLFIVWSCYILGHRKFLVGCKTNDRYYEVTYNNLKEEWYVDIYKKTYNLAIKNDDF